MKRAIIIFLIIFLGGCATVPQRREAFTSRDFINIEEFCKKYGAQYNFDTVDDIVTISSKSREAKLLLNAPLVSLNGNVFGLAKAVTYSAGVIYIPAEIEKLFVSREKAGFTIPFFIKTIVIDAGHGGKDPGAIAKSGLTEKGLNLTVAKLIKEALEERGFKVILTRSGDIFLSLQERVDIAKRHNADLFISVHTNSNRRRLVRGVEVYYLLPSRFDSEKQAISFAKEGDFWPKGLSFDARTILWDLALTKNYALSIESSRSLCTAFKNMDFKVRSPKKAPFYVLRCAYVPAVLLEIGYLSNRYEEKLLRSRYYQKQIAEAVALGVSTFNERHSALASKDVK